MLIINGKTGVLEELQSYHDHLVKTQGKLTNARERSLRAGAILAVEHLLVIFKDATIYSEAEYAEFERKLAVLAAKGTGN